MNSLVLYKIIITPSFEKAAKPLFKKYSSLKNDLQNLFQSLKSSPEQGDFLGNNCYKIRVSILSKGKGKRGGARVIFLIKVVELKVYILTIYDKSMKETVSSKELRNLLDSYL